MTSLPLRLDLVARLDPAFEGQRRIALFRETAVGSRKVARPCHVIGNIAGEQEQPAGGEDAVELRQCFGAHQTPLVLPGLGPGIGIEQKDALEALLRKRFQQHARVAVIDVDVGKLPALDQRQQLCHAVDERFRADERNIRMKCCLMRDMLAAAEADLEPAPRPRIRQRIGRIDAQPRQHFRHQL